MSRAVDRARLPCLAAPRRSNALSSIVTATSRYRTVHLALDIFQGHRRRRGGGDPAVPARSRRGSAGRRRRRDPLQGHRLLFPAGRAVPARDGHRRRSLLRAGSSAGSAPRAASAARAALALGAVAGAGARRAAVRRRAAPGPLRGLAGLDRRRRLRGARRWPPRSRCSPASAPGSTPRRPRALPLFAEGAAICSPRCRCCAAGRARSRWLLAVAVRQPPARGARSTPGLRILR